MKAIVLFAHGSRDPLWHRPIQVVAERVAMLQPGVKVVCAYLEFNSPSLENAVNDLVNQGFDNLRLVPMFLGVGKHVREDLPNMLAELGHRFPGLALETLPAVGEHPDLLQLIAEIVLEGWQA